MSCWFTFDRSEIPAANLCRPRADRGQVAAASRVTASFRGSAGAGQRAALSLLPAHSTTSLSPANATT